MVDLSQGEKIVLIVKRHWFLVFKKILFVILIAALPIILLTSLLGSINIEINFGVVLFFISLWLLIVWLGFFIVLTNYYLDMWVITNFRIVDVEQHTLFKREISEYRIENVQDVTVHVTGIFPTLLHFGKIDVQTAGEQASCFVIDYAISPNQIKNTIMQLKHDVAKLEWENQEPQEEKPTSDTKQK